MNITIANTNVELKPMTTKHSKVFYNAFREFATSLDQKNGQALVTDSHAADFLMRRAFAILKDFYKLENVINFEEFEDQITLTEACDFLTQQIEINGTADFLCRPVLSLIESFKKAMQIFEQQVASDLEKRATVVETS